jgi:hypothetical protein
MNVDAWVAWLQTPFSNAATHHLDPAAAWHGRLMVLAWAFLMPLAVVIARFFKITPRQAWPLHLDNPFWFITHRRLGYALVLIMTLGLGLMGWHRSFQFDPLRGWHAGIGWLVIFTAWLQVLASLARGTHGGPMNPFTRQSRPPEDWPGDHFSMTTRRIVFEYTHKSIGYLLVLLVVVEIFTGLNEADAPRWMWFVISAWWSICAAAFAWLQWHVGCIDTYQAIWGLDQTLPGYRRKPIGFAITRFSEDDAARAPWQKQRQHRDEHPPISSRALDAP